MLLECCRLISEVTACFTSGMKTMNYSKCCVWILQSSKPTACCDTVFLIYASVHSDIQIFEYVW